MAKHIVLKPFKYSHDFRKNDRLPVGSVHEFRAHALPGLVGGEFVRLATPEEIAAAGKPAAAPKPKAATKSPEPKSRVRKPAAKKA